MNSEADWQKAMKESPKDNTLLLAYGDWLEEQGELLRACQARESAGAGTLVFSLWHPSWGEKRRGDWTKFAHLRSHVVQKGRLNKYRRSYSDKEVPVDELVVVIEWRANPVEIERRPYARNLEL